MALTPTNDTQMNIENNIQPTTSWLINKDTNRLVYSNNTKELMRQSIDVRLQIERMQHEIYTSNAGMQTLDLVGLDLGLVISKLKRRITDCLMCDDRVLGIQDFRYAKLDKESILVEFTVNTIYDNIDYDMEWQL